MTLSVAVCIATTGRAAVLTETLRELNRQTQRPDRVLVCPAGDGDVDLAALPFPVELVRGEPGLPHQRNALLRAAGAIDVVLFIDDDFLPSPDYLAALCALFIRRPDCVIATGRVLADGATNRGYTVEEGREILRSAPAPSDRVRPVFNGYGCNMAARWSCLRAAGIWFDEHLPLYAWAEDVDFSRQASRHGSVLKADALTGVHLAWKGGRTSGVRFGYSQIANQVYLARKGTVTGLGALRKAAENVGANLVGTWRGDDAFIDRRGRLIGNVYAIADVLTGRSSPQRIFDL